MAAKNQSSTIYSLLIVYLIIDIVHECLKSYVKKIKKIAGKTVKAKNVHNTKTSSSNI